MINIISPAKSMDFESESINLDQLDAQLDSENLKLDSESLKKQESTNQQLINQQFMLVLNKLRSLSVDQISKIMKVGEKIAKLNYQRFQEFDKLPEKEALFAYNGDVYKNIDTKTLNAQSLGFAQNHLRIISALYGSLSPLDKIRAYRLEMVSKLDDLAPKGMALFWQDVITDQLNLELSNHKNKFLINIASNEYFAAINRKKFNYPIINIHFREIRNGMVRNIAINSKRARGMMADYIIRNYIDSPEEIKIFNVNDYKFDVSMSDDYNFYFLRQSLQVMDK